MRLVASAAVVLIGCLFFGDRDFYWAGELVSTQTRYGIGSCFVMLGVASSYWLGRRSAS